MNEKCETLWDDETTFSLCELERFWLPFGGPFATPWDTSRKQSWQVSRFLTPVLNCNNVYRLFFNNVPIANCSNVNKTLRQFGINNPSSNCNNTFLYLIQTFEATKIGWKGRHQEKNTVLTKFKRRSYFRNRSVAFFTNLFRLVLVMKCRCAA